jgi:hypothetical protein
MIVGFAVMIGGYLHQKGLRGTAYQLLGLYRRVHLMIDQMRGERKGESDEEKRMRRGEVWDSFCDALKAAGAAVAAGPSDPLSQAEGYRYLARLVRAGLEQFIEHQNPLFPTINSLVHQTVKIGSDNPDNLYANACISGEHSYVLAGRRNSVFYLGFCVTAGNYGDGKTNGMPTQSSLDHTEIVYDNDKEGTFQILLSRSKPGVDSGVKNWMKLTRDSDKLLVRQSFMFREKEVAADLKIIVYKANAADDDSIPANTFPLPSSAFNVKPTTQNILTAAELEKGLNSANVLVAGVPLMFAHWANGFAAKHVNSLPLFDQKTSNDAGGDPHIRYYHSYWRLEADDDCLVVIVDEPPPCEMWNFQVNNHWMESLDYRYYPVHVNNGIAKYGRDGKRVVIVLSHSPSVPAEMMEKAERNNFLTTVGHRFGTMCFRWIRCRNPDPQPQPRTIVCKQNQLLNYLNL